LFDQAGGRLFEQNPPGQWHQTARLHGDFYCDLARLGIERGEFRVEPHDWPDLVVGDHHFVMSPLSSADCSQY